MPINGGRLAAVNQKSVYSFFSFRWENQTPRRKKPSWAADEVFWKGKKECTPVPQTSLFIPICFASHTENLSQHHMTTSTTFIPGQLRICEPMLLSICQGLPGHTSQFPSFPFDILYVVFLFWLISIEIINIGCYYGAIMLWKKNPSHL